MPEVYDYPKISIPGEVSLTVSAIHSILNWGSIELLHEVEPQIPSAIVRDFLDVFFEQDSVCNGDMYVKLKKFYRAFTNKDNVSVVNDYVFRAALTPETEDVTVKSVRWLFMRDLWEPFLEGFTTAQQNNPELVLPYVFSESLYSVHFGSRYPDAPKDLPVLLFSSMPEEDIHQLFQKQIVFSVPEVTDAMYEAASHRIPIEWLQELYPNTYNPFHGR